ncbi:hypothetical protein C7B82_24245 [Stenomitos frigidus ULC18]|uniref:Uncharacterized protein n=2 Tax=Stenomitos TaxID=1844270 RepID=A0A2T1DXI3_9CYAN|nr:hypothetical protein C7B82_24245 [Stenomitos frigidus ULC18]
MLLSNIAIASSNVTMLLSNTPIASSNATMLLCTIAILPCNSVRFLHNHAIALYKLVTVLRFDEMTVISRFSKRAVTAEVRSQSGQRYASTR